MNGRDVRAIGPAAVMLEALIGEAVGADRAVRPKPAPDGLMAVCDLLGFAIAPNPTGGAR